MIVLEIVAGTSSRTVHECTQPVSEPVTKPAPRGDHPSPAAIAAGRAGAQIAADAANAANAARHEAFSDDEEAFFDAGAAHVAPPAESFTDLDDGYRPRTFWQRLFNKRPPPATVHNKKKPR